jgi:GTP-binding protein
MKFIDEVTIHIASGKGGPGSVSFRRESMAPRGGPDGGDGGKGGDLIFRADNRLGSLLDLKLRKSYHAKNGDSGRGSNQTGAYGDDLVILVPPGTVIKSEDGEVIADIGPEQEICLLKGGRGGKGNCFFKTSVNQAPLYAQPGEPGEEKTVQLELKLIADVGIIGFPNAGKSTLISRISAAKPKIADYPFTTLVPNLGVVKYGEDHNFVVADIPGLIEGAHTGAGLGTQFLRHIERTKFFVHLIDISEFAERAPLDAYAAINRELAAHDELNQDREGFQSLTAHKQIIVLNKTDTVSPERSKAVQKAFRDQGLEPFLISAATGMNIKELVFHIGRELFGKTEEE